MLTAFFAMMYCLVNGKNLFNTRVKRGLLIDIAFILLITSFFWMPFLETKFYTDYRVYEENAMSTKDSFLSHALKIKDLFITPKDTIFVFEIGLPVILMLAFSIMTFRKLEENKKEYLFFFFSGLISIWMATKYFPWKWLPSCFYIIQLPWRMLVFSSFFLAVICSINMGTLIRKFNGKDVLMISLICILYIGTRHGVIPYTNEVLPVENSPMSKVTGQDNEWLYGMGRLEYLPSKAYERTFYIATRENEIIALDGECDFQESLRIGNYMTAKIFVGEAAKLELPFIYYPGYTVRLDGMILDTFETENGFLGYYLEKNESGKLEVQYTGTKLMSVSKVLSSIAFLGYIMYVWKKH